MDTRGPTITYCPAIKVAFRVGFYEGKNCPQSPYSSSASPSVIIRTRKKAKCLTIFTHNKASPNLFLSSTKSCFLLRPYIFIFTRIISEYRFVSDSQILLFIFHFFKPLYYTTSRDLKIKVTVFFLISKLFQSLYNIYYILHSLLNRIYSHFTMCSLFFNRRVIYISKFL